MVYSSVLPAAWRDAFHPFGLLRLILRLSGRLRVRGLENFAAAGGKVLIVSNHLSPYDALLLSAALPGRILFAAPTRVARRWWLRPYWRKSCTLDQTQPIAAKTVIEALKSGQPCLSFPEGRPSRTGGLMKVYASPGMIADKAGASLLPVRLDGPQYSRATSLRGPVRKRWFPKVTVTVLPPRKLDLPADAKGHARRTLAGARLADIMEDALVLGTPMSTLLRQLMAARAIRGGSGIALEDTAREPLSHDAFVAGIFAEARLLRRRISAGETCLGVMLPNGIAAATAVFAVQALGRVTAMLNFSAGPARVVQACQMSCIRTVLSSRAFVAATHLDAMTSALEQSGVRILYVEDLAPGMAARLCGFLRAHLPAALATLGLPKDADGPAVMLFTSGTEGAPKGVMLSHRNVMGSGYQFGIHIGFAADDCIFATLPMFHSFGLGLGVLMPLFYGARVFLYPSPLRYHDIPELVYDCRATLLFGTDTFLANYARNATPHDFYFLRYAVGGAERIKAETRALWAEKFGVRLFEGYGTTEASPVITTNTPLHYRAGTVGRPVAGLDIRLKPVEGIREGAELWIRGLNVMLGYVTLDKPGVVQPPADGWYNTGDVVAEDAEGFLTILGRTKRFAKIGGEMVSLSAIENVAAAVWPGVRHVAVGIPQGRKGETIVLLTEAANADLGDLRTPFLDAGLTMLSMPRQLVKVEQIPLLGSGKTDYSSAKTLALAHASANAA